MQKKLTKTFAIGFLCIIIVFLIMFSQNCFNMQYNSKLLSKNSTGYTLTPFGCLTYGPWQAEISHHNIATFRDNNEVSSVGGENSELQNSLVFELLQNGKVNYWFKSDYDTSLVRKLLPDENGVTTTTRLNIEKSQIKKIYTNGLWKANYVDNTLFIDFGNKLLPLLNGKYANLGSGSFDLKQTFMFDSLVDGKIEKFRKVYTFHYNHPWLSESSDK